MFIKYLKSTMPSYGSIVIAFSGGLDSTVLLHQLIIWKNINPKIILRAIHINHNLSKNSNAWSLHCQSICNKWDIPCDILSIEIEKNNKKSIESNAREKRYECLKVNLKKNEILLTAHHINDQCETLLLALKRGSGPLGLSSMPIKLYLGNNNFLLRPFLFLSKSQLEKYAKVNNLIWIEDESNKNIKYDRNFLRKLLSIILKRWPYFAHTVSRSAELCGEQEKLIDELLDSELSNIISPLDGSLNFTIFSTISDIKKYALLRRWIGNQNYKMPSRKILTKIINEVIFSKKDANPCLKVDNYNIRRFHQKIYLLSNSYSSLKNNTLFWRDINKHLLLPNNLGYLKGSLNRSSVLRLPKKDEVVNIKFQYKGYVNLFNRCGKRKINLLWKEINIPPWERERIPLIFYNNVLISAPGIFITKEGIINVNLNQIGWQINWQKIIK